MNFPAFQLAESVALVAAPQPPTANATLADHAPAAAEPTSSAAASILPAPRADLLPLQNSQSPIHNSQLPSYAEGELRLAHQKAHTTDYLTAVQAVSK